MVYEKLMIVLPCNGKQGNKLLLKIRKDLSKSLLNDVKTTFTYQTKKLGRKFELKDKTKFQ